MDENNGNSQEDARADIDQPEQSQHNTKKVNQADDTGEVHHSFNRFSLPPEENDKQSKARHQNASFGAKPDIRICGQCLADAYGGGNKDKLITFCQENFNEVFIDLDERSDNFSSIRRQILAYCSNNLCFDYFWKIIQAERPKIYDIYFPQWQKVERKEDEYKYSNEDNVKKTIRKKSESHPLSSSNDDVIDWFFNKLDKNMQSTVITVALFEGINKKLIGKITRDIEHIIFTQTR